MRLSIVIVGYKSRKYLQDNLVHLEKALLEVGEAEVIVVDNASGDGTLGMLAEMFPWVRAVGNDVNRGFAAACNQGVRMATARCVLFLNPDMRVPVGVLEAAVYKVERTPSIGALTVQLRREDGTILPTIRRDPGLLDQLALLFKLAHVWPNLSVLRRYRGDDVDLTISQSVEQCRASFLLMRREVLDAVGWWDERFFLWFEDVDLCRRIRAADYQVWYEASVFATDLYGRSAVQVPLWKKQWWFFSSAAKYFWKWK